MIDDSDGPGPWYVFMLINVVGGTSGGNSKKQTEIRISSYPQLYKQIKNTLTNGNWVIVEQFGPMNDWNEALGIYNKWGERSRGQGPRIAKGLILRKQYKNVQFTYLNQSKDEVVKMFTDRKDNNKKRKKKKQKTTNDGDGGKTIYMYQIM